MTNKVSIEERFKFESELEKTTENLLGKGYDVFADCANEVISVIVWSPVGTVIEGRHSWEKYKEKINDLAHRIQLEVLFS